MFSEKEYNLVMDKLYSMINELSNDNNDISMDVVNKIINDRIKNKSRIKKLSFNITDE